MAAEMDNEPMVVRPLFELSGKLLNRMNLEKYPVNVIMSPVSIHQALSMVVLGSEEGSLTKRGILDTIGYSKMSEEQVEQCHQDYAKLISDFAQISDASLKEREEYEKQKKEGLPECELSTPKSPILEMLTMMVTKNRAEANPNYEKDIESYFHASISNIDDKKPETKSDLVKKLNDWARKAGFESLIMEPEYLWPEYLEALLITAIRVESFWFNQLTESFDKNIFYNNGLKDKPVDGQLLSARDIRGSHFLEFTKKELAKVVDLHERMSKDDSFNKLSGLNFRAVDIPLRGNMSFAIFEPVSADNESPETKPNAKLSKLVEKLFSNYEDEAQNSSQVSLNLVEALELLDRANNDNKIDYLRMPKFKFESDINLKPVLKAVGIKRGFDDKLSEISNITSDRLYIEDVKHKAVIETTEAGIKAAAMTVIMMANCVSLMEPSTRIEVRVENPFMFVLRYQKMPLFVGQLTKLLS